MWKIKKNKGQIAFNAERVLMAAKAPLDSVVYLGIFSKCP